MTKRLVDIDDELLAQAKALLGTDTMKDTVNQALREVIDAELRRRHVVRLIEMDGLDLNDPEVMAGAWRS
jgi:Arc/MetJ family transcription regulator